MDDPMSTGMRIYPPQAEQTSNRSIVHVEGGGFTPSMAVSQCILFSHIQ